MTDLAALLTLLDDPDPAVRAPLLARLRADRALLDRAWAQAEARGAPPAALVETVLAVDAESLVEAYTAAEDLEEGAWLLPRLHRPRCEFETAGRQALDRLAQRLPDGCDGGAIARFLCTDCGFAGDRRTYDDPQNSYLPLVLERRLGLPIALTALWILLGRRQRLELEALALPGHVYGRWRGGVIDLFAGGRAVGRDEIDARIHAAGGTQPAPYLKPASDRALLRRMAANLVGSYARRGDALRAGIARALAA